MIAKTVTLDSAVLGLAHRGVVGTVLGFRPNVPLDDAIELHAFALLEALSCV